MTSPTYRTDHADDPELFGRLMRERYGPLPKVLAELKRPGPPPPLAAPKRRQTMTAPTTPPQAHDPNPDPNADEHYAELIAGIEEAGIGRPRLHKSGGLLPPYPGAMWCHSCDSWCSPQGWCRCNNR